MNELIISEDIFLSNNKTIKTRLIKELRSLYSDRNDINYYIERKSSGYWIRQVNEPNYNRLLEDICNCIDEKMKINKLRKWGKPDDNGVINHLKK